MIEARGLVKRYGPTIAVDHLSFDVRPGTVTGFLGPNGAGKSTTMRMIARLDRPSRAEAGAEPGARFAGRGPWSRGPVNPRVELRPAESSTRGPMAWRARRPSVHGAGPNGDRLPTGGTP